MTKGSAYDYGRAGRIGVGTPQANPTVETEFSILVPPAASITVARLTSSAPAARDRLCGYLLQLGDHLESFDSFRPDIFGFACTASSYLVAPDEARRVLADCEERFGYPIITAADAVAWTLNHIGAKRIALLSPYPSTLADLAAAYWAANGFELVDTGQAGHLAPDADTRGIYALGSADAAEALSAIDLSNVDAVLFSGTGMPSLPLIMSANSGTPILSSNLCLAAMICRRLGLGDLLDQDSIIGRAWRARCRAAITSGSPQ